MTSMSFSQTDTTVCLSSDVAKEVVKELVTFDGLQQEQQILDRKIQLLKTKLVSKDTIIFEVSRKLENTQNIAYLRHQQLRNVEEVNILLNKELSSEKRKTNFWKTATVVVGAVFGVVALLAN